MTVDIYNNILTENAFINKIAREKSQPILYNI